MPLIQSRLHFVIFSLSISGLQTLPLKSLLGTMVSVKFWLKKGVLASGFLPTKAPIPGVAEILELPPG